MQMTRLKQTWPFQALADNTRFRIMRLLLAIQTPICVGEIAKALSLPSNHITKHIQILEISGLIVIYKKGRSCFVSAANSNENTKAIFMAVIGMSDESGIHKEDLSRLLEEEGEVACSND